MNEISAWRPRSACEPCQPGKISWSDKCKPCDFGKYAKESCATARTFCADGEVPTTQQYDCEGCPPGILPNARGFCEVICPIGVTCNRDGIFAKAGYWRPSVKNLTYLPETFPACPQRGACAPRNICAESYMGIACASCSHGYARQSLQCVGCT